MSDRTSSQRKTVQIARHLIYFIAGSTHIVTFRLLWLALLFYGERAVFHDAANGCAWPMPPHSSATSPQPAVHVLLVTDPQIIDRNTYPDLPWISLLYPIVRHFSDNYLKNVWTSLVINPNKWFHRGYILPPNLEAQRRQTSKAAGMVQPPDGVVWMGDLTDGGRRGRSDAEWAALVHRFRNIFWRPREADWEALKSTLSTTRQLIEPRTSATNFIPTIHLSGNHDIGLPGSSSGHRVDVLAADDAIERFNREFGMKIDGGGFVVKDRNPFQKSSLNGRVLVSSDTALGATHELVLINAQDLVGMEREGGGPFDTHLSSDHLGKLDGQLGDNAHREYKDTYDFVESVKLGGIQIPRVLLSHVPLHRPAMTTCNDAQRSARHRVQRESSRPLHQGTDRGSTYQNMVSSSVTDWVLRTIDPMAVFSGDDHDHCEYRHSRLSSNSSKLNVVEGFKANEVPELTVKSISMTEGVRKPGFARLSLFPPPFTSSSQPDTPPYVTMAYTPCLLPDQIGIWTRLYLPFFIITLLGLWFWPRSFMSRSDADGYLPLSHQRKRNDDHLPPSSEQHHPTSSGMINSSRWKRDVVAVALVALPWWILCQTHFLF